MAILGDFLSSQAGGMWWRGDFNNEFLPAMSDGFWRETVPTYNISGSVAGEGKVTVYTVLWQYIYGNVLGYGSIDANLLFNTIVRVSGEVIGIGIISSTISERSNTIVEGAVAGIGKIKYNMNSSKLYSYNPLLIHEQNAYNPGDCPIAAIEYQGFSPNKIINITSKENTMYENSLDFYQVEYIGKSGEYYPIKHYPYNTLYNDKLNYLVTDFFSNSQNGKPLFYQYELMFDAYSAISGVAIKNIYKNNEIKIDKSEYKIQYSYDLLGDGFTRYSETDWGDIRTSKTHRVRVLLPSYFDNKSDFFVIEYDRYIFGTSNYQKELIELQNIYSPLDFTISGYNGESRLYTNPNSLLANSNTLAIIKNPASRIYPLEIISLKGQNQYSSDQVTQWKLRLNTGAFFHTSGTYAGFEGHLYNLDNPNQGNDDQRPLTNVKPLQTNSNIIQIKETPIYIDESVYKYPLYKVEKYDKNIYSIYDQRGKFSIDVNGISRDDIKIKSIDRKKGFIEFDTDFNPMDEVEVNFYVENSGFIIMENLELNPKINDSGAAYKISNFPNGIGVGIKPWDGGSTSQYPYIYHLSNPGTAYQVPDIGFAGEITTEVEDIFTICELDLNKLTTDIVKVTDARKVGGGIQPSKELDRWFVTNYSGITEHEPSWYTDIGSYDGTPLSNNSLIIIHIPETMINQMRNKWITYYKDSLEYDRAEVVGDREFKFHLDQTVRRYISAGTDYIIIPTISGQITGKFLNLR